MTLSAQARISTHHRSSSQPAQRRDGAAVGQSPLASLSAALNDNWQAHGPGRGAVQRFLAQDYAGFSAGVAANRDLVRGYRQYISPDYLKVVGRLAALPGPYAGMLRAKYDHAAMLIQAAPLTNRAGIWTEIADVLDSLRNATNGWAALLTDCKFGWVMRQYDNRLSLLESESTLDFYRHGERSSRLALTALYGDFFTALQGADTAVEWAALQLPLLELERALELARDLTGKEDPFSNKARGNWRSAEDGLVAMHGVPTIGQQAPVNGNPMQPNIPVIAWRAARGMLPPSLRDLLTEIYLAWKGHQVMDRRSNQEKIERTKNSNTPGALRSWHMNDQAQLPNVGVAANLLNHPLHPHYQAHSVKPYDEEAAGPIGYAEYTGTGIDQDSHFSKVVLNYHSGMVYLTLSHYGVWTPGLNGAQPTMYGKRDGQGTQSAWFALDMRQ